MNAPAEVQLTSGTVAPGGTLDVSVQLKAPNSEGTYKGFFRLRSGSGVIFGIGNNADVSFWVEIEVLSELADPDLVVTAINFDPYPPTKNDSVTVRVKIKNQGGTTDEAFTVKWWPGENYPNPGNSWNVNGGLDAGESVTLTYVYAGYPSTYSGINTKASVDTGDTVGESNEGNNTFLRSIDVNP
jgi:subtilase family serine protease